MSIKLNDTQLVLLSAASQLRLGRVLDQQRFPRCRCERLFDDTNEGHQSLRPNRTMFSAGTGPKSVTTVLRSSVRTGEPAVADYVRDKDRRYLSGLAHGPPPAVGT